MPSITYDPVDTPVGPGQLPRAQGASFTPAVGQALEQVGQQGGRIASDLNRIDYMREQYDEMSRAAKMAGNARIQFTKAFQDQTAEYNNTNGDGFVDKFQGQIDNFTNEGSQQFKNPRAKASFEEHMASIKSTFLDHSINWQYNQAQVYRETNLQDGFRDTVNAVSEDPTQFQSALDQSVKSIEGIPHELNPLALATQHRLKNQITDQLVKAAGLKSAQVTPQATKNAILGITPSAPDTVTGKIVNAAQQAPPQAQRAGLTPNVALAVASAENDTFDPNRPNAAGSSAKGLFQMIDSTWVEKGGTPENRNDPNAQAQIGIKNLADNTAQLSSVLKRPLSPGEVYSTQWGVGFAGSLASARDGVPVRDIFARTGSTDPDAAAAANGVASMTAGQLRTHFETMMRERMAKTAGLANQPADDSKTATPSPDMPWLKYASPELRQALLTHAEANLRHDDAGERVSLNQDFSDIKAAYTSGQIPQQEWDPSRALRVDGAIEGARKNNEIVQAQWYGHAASQLNTAGPAEMGEIVKQADAKLGVNAPGSYGYAQAKAYSDSLHVAAANINNLRVADQVGQDQKSLQLTKPLDFTTPEFLTGPLAARYEQAGELQRTWGMKDYKPLSDQEASGLSDFLAKGEPSQIVNYMASMRVAAGEHTERYSALMQQIAPKAPLTAVAGAVAPYDPQMAQLILVGAGNTKYAKELGIAVQPKLLEQRWQQERGQAFGSSIDNSQLTLSAVKAAYTAMLPPDRRDSKNIDDDTWNNVANRIAPVVDFNGPTLAPIGMNHDQFVANVGARYSAALTKAGYDPADYRMETVKLIPNPKADGVYQVFSGLTLIRGAVIDFNTPPDTTFTPVSLETTPADFQRKMARKNPTFGTSKY